MEKIQGLVISSVRTYLGVQDGRDCWEHADYILGIREGEKLKDYKTGEEYDFISRDDYGRMMITRAEAVKDHTYAIEIDLRFFDQNKFYSKREIDTFVKNCNLFTDEYKQIGMPEKKKTKMIIFKLNK